MPENRRKFMEYNTESFPKWGESVGTSTILVIKSFLYMHKVEQQGYKSYASLMKLADCYGVERLENACIKALSYTPSSSLKNITTILKNGQDKVSSSRVKKSMESIRYGIIRGAFYFKGGILMIRQPTLDKLHEMCLHVMSEAFENRCKIRLHMADFPLKTALEC